jgi:formiminotetrahydrofolate cyclodeaminase
VALVNLKVSELLERLASTDPTPGGGSAAALSGSLAAALVAMVCAMEKTRSGSPAERTTLQAALGGAQKAGARLRELVDLDSAAYEGVMAAYKLPKGTDSEKALRKETIARALDVATKIPLETAEECLKVLRAAGEAKEFGNPNATSDALTGAALALAGLLGAAENVRINAPGSEPASRVQVLVEEGVRASAQLGLPIKAGA